MKERQKQGHTENIKEWKDDWNANKPERRKNKTR